MWRWRTDGVAAIVLASCLLTSFPVAAGHDHARLDTRATETLHYRWQLRGFLGRLASLVFPGTGHGELRTHLAPDDGLTTELEITSPEAAEEEYYLYGSRSEESGQAKEAWSSYRWRDEEESKRERIDDSGVVDIAAGIHVIRQRRPDEPLPLRIWSDGKIYPVVVEPRPATEITVPAGTFTTDHYSVHGIRRGGERYWGGGLELWLARDREATPVRIQVERGWTTVRLELLDGEAT